MHDLNLHLFPFPQEVTPLGTRFRLDESCQVLVPQVPQGADLALARFVVAELSDRYGLGLQIKRVSDISLTGNAIVIGSAANPLIQAWCEQQAIALSNEDPGPEGYVLCVQDMRIVVAGSDEQGAFYGLQTLRQLIAREGSAVGVPGVFIRDWPYKRFRGLRIYLPGGEHIGFFKRFVRDFAALFKFNTLILEVNAGMRLDRHPELNAGSVAFSRDMDYCRSGEPVSPHGEYQDSSHHDAVDGGILEKEEVAELVRYANAYHIQVIPEIPSLTHAYYLLTRHHELAEIQYARWPDTYCPSNPGSYELLFDVMDEYIEVMRPRMVHIGHDEWRMPVGVCGRCRDQDYRDLFIQDVTKIYSYLHRRGIEVAMWGDHLMESVRNNGLRERIAANGQPYRVPGALSENQVKERIPKDILIFNWFWADSEGWLVPHGYKGEDNDVKLAEWGFKQVYGNFEPGIQDWDRRSARNSVLGGAPSAWAATTELNFGKDLLVEFMGCANLLWFGRQITEEQFLAIVREKMPRVRRCLRVGTEPSQHGDPIVPIGIFSHSNALAGSEVMGQDLLSGLLSGKVQVDGKVFELIDPDLSNGYKAIVIGSQGQEGQSLASEVCGIEIGQDVSSLILLHACARPGQNLRGFHQIYNQVDTAELLGWYEVVYEDGFIETIPIRYGVNILDWRGQVLYGADAVDCAIPGWGEPRWFFAFEWRNPRLGRVIREVNLKGTAGFRKCQVWYGVSDEPVPSNAVVLLALSVLARRED